MEDGNNSAIARIGKFLIILFVALAVIGFMSQAYSSISDKAAKAEPAKGVDSISKERYMQALVDNGYGATEQCAYSKFIDNHSVKEALKFDLDYATDASGAATDPRTTEIQSYMAECL